MSDTEASFLDLHLSILDDFVKTMIYNKRDDFDFDIAKFPFLYGDVPLSTSYGVYIYQLIRFSRVSSHADDFNSRNKVLTAKLLRQGYRYHKLDCRLQTNFAVVLLLAVRRQLFYFGSLVVLDVVFRY